MKVKHEIPGPAPALLVIIMATALLPVRAQSDFEVVMSRVHESAMERASHKGLDTILELLQPDGSFSDLHYGEDASASFMTHGSRLGAMAYHYNIGEDVAEHLLISFTFITYDAPDNPDSNWWGHVIGTPLKMWQGAVLARELLPSNLLTDFLDRYWVNTMVGPVWDHTDTSGNMAGGNFAPRALLAEVEGLLRGFPTAVHAQVQEGMFREVVERQGYNMNGLRADGCLHQHSVQGEHNTEHGYLDHTLGLIYNGDYGKEQLKYTSQLLTWYTGTNADFEDAIIEGVFASYLECNQWLYRGHTYEPTTTGRFITNGLMVTRYATQGGVRDTGKNLQALGRHQEALDAALHRFEHVRPDARSALVGNKHFFNSDLTVHQRRDYMASVRVLSNRTSRPETWLSGQNIDGFFQGDGFLTVLVDAEEYGTPKHEVFQVYDWARVPGVTNLYTTDIPQYHIGAYWAERFINNAVYVGGVTDGLVGLTFMEYNRPHVMLTALKSWFFFDDVIVVLGSDISLGADDTTGENVATTLIQGSYAGEHTVGRKGGSELQLGQGLHKEEHPAWLHHRQVGYVFLGGDEQLTVTAEARPWNEGTINVFTAWLDHGPHPQDAKVSYAVLPATDLDRTREFALNPEVLVLSQTSELHAVCHTTSKMVGAAFVSGGVVTVSSCGGVGPLEIWVDNPCLVLATIQGSQITVSVADPQQKYDVIHLKVTLENNQMEHTVLLPDPPKRGSSVTAILTL